jgi:hypothetical protein
MNRNQKIILATGAIILITLIVHPPYFGIDRESAGKLHAFIGYHWIWDPPLAPDVYERLTKSGTTGVDPLRLASFETRISTVRLIQNVVVLGAAVALGMALLRKRAKAPNTACS